jgi:hypothetical protein
MVMVFFAANYAFWLELAFSDLVFCMCFGCAQWPLVLQVLLVLWLCSVSLGFAFVAGNSRAAQK